MTDSVVVDMLRTVPSVSSFPLNPSAFLFAPWAQLRWRAINILVIILPINQSTVDLFGASGLRKVTHVHGTWSGWRRGGGLGIKSENRNVTVTY